MKKMSVMKRLLLLLLFVFIMYSCKQHQSPSLFTSNAEALNLKGPVYKLEMLTLSSVPDADILNNIYGFYGWYSMFIGNSTLYFNKEGNMIRLDYFNDDGSLYISTKYKYAGGRAKSAENRKMKYTVKYHKDGNSLKFRFFDTKQTMLKRYYISPSKSQDSMFLYDHYDRVMEKQTYSSFPFCFTKSKGNYQYEYDDDGNLVNAVFSKSYIINGDTVFSVDNEIPEIYYFDTLPPFIHPLKNGEKAPKKCFVDTLFVSRGDSTVYTFTKYDEYDNWIECKKDVYLSWRDTCLKGKVIRRITYREEEEKEPLINKLDELKKSYLKPDEICELETVQVDEYLLPIPITMKNCPEERLQDDVSSILDFLYKCKNKSQYATISVKIQPKDISAVPEILEYVDIPEEINRSFEICLMEMLADTDTPLIAYYGAKRVKVGNNITALHYGYLRQGLPIPVRVDVYSIQSDDKVVIIALSYRTSEKHLWHKNFENVINGITKIY